MTYVYFIINDIGKFYIGSTNDLRMRLKKHNSGQVTSTRGQKWRLVYYEAYLEEHDARVREQKLKYHANGVIQLKKRMVGSILKAKNNSEG